MSEALEYLKAFMDIISADIFFSSHTEEVVMVNHFDCLQQQTKHLACYDHRIVKDYRIVSSKDYGIVSSGVQQKKLFYDNGVDGLPSKTDKASAKTTAAGLNLISDVELTQDNKILAQNDGILKKNELIKNTNKLTRKSIKESYGDISKRRKNKKLTFRRISPSSVAFLDNTLVVADIARSKLCLFDEVDVENIKLVSEIAFPSICDVTTHNGKLFITDPQSKTLHISDGKNSEKLHFPFIGYLWGVCVSAERIYLTDMENGRVHICTRSGKISKSFGTEGNGSRDLSLPRYICCSDDHVYVSDTGNSRVQVFDTDGNHKYSIGAHFSEKRGCFATPSGMCMDTLAGKMFVCDDTLNCVQVFDVSAFTHLESFGESGAECQQLHSPKGICVKNNKVYVADSMNYRVQLFVL